MAQLSLLTKVQKCQTQLLEGLTTTTTTTIIMMTPPLIITTTINIPVTRISRYISRIRVILLLITTTIPPISSTNMIINLAAALITNICNLL